MGKCMLVGFKKDGFSKKFEEWAVSNLVSSQQIITKRGTTAVYLWCKTNFTTAKQEIPEPTRYSFDTLKEWAKENFIMTREGV